MEGDGNSRSNITPAGGEAKAMKAPGIKELVDGGLTEVPPAYVWPPHDRPAIPVHDDEAAQQLLPVIDMADLADCSSAGQERRSRVVERIGRACEEWGFFQVINHGVSATTIQGIREAAVAFFSLPAAERMKWHNDNLYAPILYSTSFNPSVEMAREWRDTVIFNRISGVCDGFHEAPEVFRKHLQVYIDGVERVANVLYKSIFESLGVKDMKKAGVPEIPNFGLFFHYFPPCPNPNLTLGIVDHCDHQSLTILHPDFDVPGLEVCKDGKWLPLNPCHPDAFIINVADQIEILTNGKYKSAKHRVITNARKPRLSIPTFFSPTGDTVIAPLPDLVNGITSPAIYKPIIYDDYMKSIAENSINPHQGALDFAKA